MAAKTDSHPAEALGPAKETATRLRAQLSALESDLAQALESKDYSRAETAQRAANGLRPAVLLSEAQATALGAAVAALRAHDEQENAVAVQREREERAESDRAAATASERKAHAEAQQHLEAAQSAVKEAAASLREAFAAEMRETEFRQEANRIEVEVGWVEPSAFGVSPAQHIGPAVDLDPVLIAIRRSGV
ncbi:hypothetical protein ACFWIB_10975 [Streptomyces sp. NPDC127051]|uniref:hypothetical protein n=1 Tax=Streptomyces sp. NPDC127051 TaxID=3347119 RepID=UPI003668DA55